MRTMILYQKTSASIAQEGNPMNKRITDHCFVPQPTYQLQDVCAFPDCGRSEIEHEWTVEASEANPDRPIEQAPETRNERLEHETWTTWGVVEIAIRNPAVNEYMNHWEGRTRDAEELARNLEAENSELRAKVNKVNELATLLAECRDALPYISATSGRRRGISLSTSRRIDNALEPWGTEP